MPGTKRTPIHRINRGLSWSARMEFELGFKGENFSTWDEYRAGWERFRHILMAQLEWGFRPAAWWDFDAPIRRPRDHDYDEAALWEAGLLTPEERTQLEARWRQHFNDANEPDWVGYCIGHAKPGDTFATWLHGDEGRRAHYKWAGLPRPLIKKWTAEHKRRVKRRSKTIRQLAESAQEPPVEPAPQPKPAPPEAQPERPPSPPLIG